MPILLDHQLREQIPHDAQVFPITYFHDELESLPNWSGPLHWHPDFEIATAKAGVLDYQVGRHHIILCEGDSIFVNTNMLHGISQIRGDVPDPMPNVVFSGTVVAPEPSLIYKKYILPVSQCDSLPYIVFRQSNSCHSEINSLIDRIYRSMSDKEQCYEMAVQRDLSKIFEYIYSNLNDFPKSESTRIQINNQIRIQKMLQYIYEHYSEAITLDEIARSANISRSEASRCFNTYMGCSPIDALIRYRLQMAHEMLSEKTYTLQHISYSCGFNSVNYFSRQFKKVYGYTPSQSDSMGK